jgi:sugar phosphate isomerase/epimerase
LGVWINLFNMEDFSKLCLHTFTNKPWNLSQCIENYSKAGIKGISIWRNVLEGQDLKLVKRQLAEADISIVSLVRGGFFPSVNASERALAIEDNIRLIEEAAVLGAPLIVLVCGSDGRQSLEISRDQIQEGIEKLLPLAIENGVKLAIEPLHPMYAGDKSAVNTLAQANNMVEAISSPQVGVAIDVYHVWWDPYLEVEIRRCGQNNSLFAFHICDWNVPTLDFLTDRGLMGDGCIPIKKIRSWVEEAGFSGFNEVEIFSDKYWAMDQQVYLDKIKLAYLKHS